MTDLMNRLTDHRPTADELDRIWAPEQRSVVLFRVLNGAPARRSAGRGLVLAAAAALVVAVPITQEVLAPEPAQANADLLALAAVADGPALEPGQLLHLRTHSEQQNHRPYQGGASWVTEREVWIGWDGSYTAIETRPGRDQIHEYYRSAAPERPSLADPTPEFVATLPTDPDAFRAYVDLRVGGGSSHEEALYSAVANLIGSQFLPPDVLSAALTALADVDGVRTEDVVVDGRDAVRISYERVVAGSPVSLDSVTVDRATARPLTEETRSDQVTYDATTTAIDVATSLPDEVRAVFRQYPDGELLCPDGRPATGTPEPGCA